MQESAQHPVCSLELIVQVPLVPFLVLLVCVLILALVPRSRKPISNSKPHKSNDMGWEAIQALRTRDGAVGLSHFKLLRRLGCGDIGSVYLCELRGTDCYFAMKVSFNGFFSGDYPQ